jgi:anti-anti-sigma factor
MNEKIDKSNILVIRPKIKMGTDQIDFLILDSGGGEQLMDRRDVPSGVSCFAGLKPVILKVLGSSPSLMLVDLGQVTWMNSTSLGDLVDLYHDMESDQGKLAMVNPNPRVKTIFEVTQLDRVFSVFDTMERGVTYLRTGRKPGGI